MSYLSPVCVIVKALQHGMISDKVNYQLSPVLIIVIFYQNDNYLSPAKSSYCFKIVTCV